LPFLAPQSLFLTYFRRDENDRGVLMLCDPRLITKSYGKKAGKATYEAYA
jgi:hypothetical protein